MRKRHSLAMIGTAIALAMSPVAGPAAAQGVAGPYLAAKQAEARGDVAAAARLYASTLTRDPENLFVMERAMLYEIGAGRVADGVALARKFDEQRPDHHLGVLAIAADALKKDDPKAARAALGENPPYVGKVMDAWAAYAEGDTEAARTQLTDLENSDENGAPGKIIAAYHLGLIEAAEGNDEAAEAALKRAAEMANGGTLRLAELRAGALARLGKKDEAVRVIRDRLAGTYGDAALSDLADRIESGFVPEPLVTNAKQGAAEVLFGVSGLLARGRNRPIALAYSRLATYLNPKLAEAQLLIAQILDQDQQYDLAIAAYNEVPDDTPQALSAWIGKAEAKQAAERVEEGVADLRAAAKKFPEELIVHTALGDMLRRESRFEEGAVAYAKAIDLLKNVEPHHWGLFYQRGITYERSKQWDKAESDFRKALELEPDQPDVLNYLGYSLVERRENLDEAEKMIERAVEQRPDDGYIVDSLGWILYRFGDFQRAVEQLERAVELRPVDAVINDHFGDALWMVGRRTEARFQWKRALSFDPDDDVAERIRRKLEVGLDKVLAEEKEEGIIGIIGRNSTEKSGTNDGG